MRVLLIALTAAMGLSACGDRRSFDERFADTQRNIEQRAYNLDAHLDNSDQVTRNEDREPDQGAKR